MNLIERILCYFAFGSKWVEEYEEIDNDIKECKLMAEISYNEIKHGRDGWILFGNYLNYKNKT